MNKVTDFFVGGWGSGLEKKIGGKQFEKSRK